MPLLNHIHPFEDTQLGIWHITETAEELLNSFVLTVAEEAELAGIKSPKTRLQWLGSRRLVRHLCGCGLVKDQYGKPHLEGRDEHVSISHTKGYAAVIISNKPVGIDINRLDKNIENIAHKFINDAEAECLPEGPGKSVYIHLFWAAKEAMYKLYGKKEIEFLTDLVINPFVLQAKGVLTGKILKKEFPPNELDIHYFFERGYVVAWLFTYNYTQIS